jgi:ribonuclease HI
VSERVPDRPSVTIHTDGGCQGNPGPGAWAAVLVSGRHRHEITGSELATTNNRMELCAAIQSLRILNRPCEVLLYTDSEYLRNGITKWIQGWKRNGWKTASRDPVKNRDLWQALEEQGLRHRIEWRWLKGHAGHRENERCDQLATRAMDALHQAHSREALKAALLQFEAENSRG